MPALSAAEVIWTTKSWAWFSHRIVQVVESVGGKVNISGLEALSHQPGPLVYIANHMSLLETLILPGIALAFNRVTFVIKEELRHYPVIRHIYDSAEADCGFAAESP